MAQCEQVIERGEVEVECSLMYRIGVVVLLHKKLYIMFKMLSISMR